MSHLPPMRLCDLTFSYTETSGGIRRYLDQKRRFLLDRTPHEHVLIIPGEKDEVVREGRATTYRIASPIIPGCAPYRFFWRPDKIKAALREADVDVIELASFYVCPWAAFTYREEMEKIGRRCLVAGYFHTDIADAYVGSPLRKAMDGLGHWSETLKDLGHKLAGAAEGEAEDYFASIFRRCDLAMAATPPQAERLRDYGVTDVKIVPLGVDLDNFHPRHRDPALREIWGAAPDEPVLIYAGRLDSEKHVTTLAEAHRRLPEGLGTHLVLMGNGPMRKKLLARSKRQPRLHVLPFESDSADFARCLASADVYVTAGPHETFGLSVIEAQASQLPVVGVNAGALRERVHEGLGFLVPVDDPTAMAKSIQRAYGDRATLGAHARAHVEESFSWSSTFERLLALYVHQVPPLAAA